MSRATFHAFWLGTAAALWLSPALAGSFSISPLRADLSQRATTAALKVRNQDTQPVVVQAESLAWAQSGGRDQLEPTRDLLVSPPLFTLGPGEEQVLRVALRRAVDPQRELSYRLMLQEVPAPQATEVTGLNVVLRLSIPVFVAPAVPAAPALAWSVRRGDDGQLVVRARNDGDAHARVLNFRLSPAATEGAAVEQPVVAYLLPGQGREWALDDPAPGAARVRLSGRSDIEEFDLELAIAP